MVSGFNQRVREDQQDQADGYQDEYYDTESLYDASVQQMGAGVKNRVKTTEGTMRSPRRNALEMATKLNDISN